RMATGMMMLMLTTSTSSNSRNYQPRDRTTPGNNHSGYGGCTCAIGVLVAFSGASGFLTRLALDKFQQSSSPAEGYIVMMMVIPLILILLSMAIFVAAVIAESKYVESWLLSRTTLLCIAALIIGRPESSIPVQSACFAIGMVLVPPIIAMCSRTANAEERAKKAETLAMEA
ncbi:hypothetical protein PMAYCL1PPCAC_10003, partial [Pristionchus mayeri]